MIPIQTVSSSPLQFCFAAFLGGIKPEDAHNDKNSFSCDGISALMFVTLTENRRTDRQNLGKVLLDYMPPNPSAILTVGVLGNVVPKKNFSKLWIHMQSLVY